MAKKAKTTYDWRDYPDYQQLRSGIKVSWYYYASEADAKKASEAARHNAQIQWNLGYDFGYQSPGHVVLMGNPEPYGRKELAGLYEVCIP